jgi:hypothetical protein
MAFSKAFNEDERSYIRRNWGFMTSGDIARELNEQYKTYNEGKRTADGVRRYIADMTGAKVPIELPREIKDQLKDNGHDPRVVQKAVEQGVKAALGPLIEKPLSKGKAKVQA